jgi:pilus assembly protein CpaC
MTLFAAAALLCAEVTGAAAPASNRLAATDLKLTLGRSLVIDYPVDIARISTSDPAVADAVPATSREFLVHGKGYGVATIVVWSKSGLRSLYNVAVEPDVEPIRRLLRETFPSENIQVQAARDEVTLTGSVSSKEVFDRAALIAAPLAKAVVNNLQLAPPPAAPQIVLKVRFAELNRNVGTSFAVNLVGLGNTIGRTTTGQFSAPNMQVDGGAPRVSISDALNIFAFRPDLDLMVFIRALQNEGVLQILAEPNLVTTPGKEASFVVGGEFPVPIVQGGANVGAVTIQFREFGVRLTFNPEITVRDTIKLYVRPEVSTLDFANAITLSGFTIPALATRRVETNIELARGQSFVIGGLIDDRVTENLSRIPGLANIPVLGTIFKSRAENRSKTELIVLVTPEIAAPIEAGQPAPSPNFPKAFLPDIEKITKNGSSTKPKAVSKTAPPAAAPGAAVSAAVRPGLRENRDSRLSAIPAAAANPAARSK